MDLHRVLYKKIPDKANLLCQGRIFIRGATLIRIFMRTLRCAITHPATHVCPHVIEYSAHQRFCSTPSAAHLDILQLHPGLSYPRFSVRRLFVYLPLQQFEEV